MGTPASICFGDSKAAIFAFGMADDDDNDVGDADNEMSDYDEHEHECGGIRRGQRICLYVSRA